MEKLSEVTQERRLPLAIQLHDYLWDHRFVGRAVLPAVEAMQLLAHSVQQFDPHFDVHRMEDAAFERFLYLEEIAEGLLPGIFNHLQVHADGGATACLVTRQRFKKMKMTRLKNHVTVKFHALGSAVAQALDSAPPAVPGTLEGNLFEVPADKVYRHLVPFGPTYRNIQQRLQITESGVLAKIKNPDVGASSTRPLGSPFALDAAFHAACAWGQRFSPIVAFPVGFHRRIILKPTRPSETYLAWIQPNRADSTPEQLVFDLWLYDTKEQLCEAVLGLRMQDVSRGRLKPPDWIKDGL
jgi:hypothetical protein